MAMITRMMIGSTVQTISIRVLWVLVEGTGFALALNRTMTMTRSARTKSVMRPGGPEQDAVVEDGDRVHDRGHGVFEVDLAGEAWW